MVQLMCRGGKRGRRGTENGRLIQYYGVEYVNNAVRNTVERFHLF